MTSEEFARASSEQRAEPGPCEWSLPPDLGEAEIWAVWAWLATRTAPGTLAERLERVANAAQEAASAPVPAYLSDLVRLERVNEKTFLAGVVRAARYLADRAAAAGEA